MGRGFNKRAYEHPKALPHTWKPKLCKLCRSKVGLEACFWALLVNTSHTRILVSAGHAGRWSGPYYIHTAPGHNPYCAMQRIPKLVRRKPCRMESHTCRTLNPRRSIFVSSGFEHPNPKISVWHNVPKPKDILWFSRRRKTPWMPKHKDYSVKPYGSSI